MKEVDRMKKRWKYQSLKHMGGYYKILQELTWRFYFRFIKGSKGWFTSCIKCQETLDRFYKENTLLLNDILISIIHDRKNIAPYHQKIICKKCDEAIVKMMEEAEEVIFGNTDYEPLVEVSRLWLDNDDEVHDVTKKEYEENRPYKYI